MRPFAPFAWLALMHVARGGELDEFAASRAQAARQRLSPDPPAGSVDSEKPLTGEDVLLRAFRLADANNDGRLSYDELVSGMLFTWKHADRLESALRAFELPTMRDFMAAHDMDQDGYLDSAEFKNVPAPTELQEKDTGHCPALTSKIESCPTHLVLQCSEYFRAAEGLCYGGHRSHVETCVMTESCENMCKCIRNVEAAVAGNASLVVQAADGNLVQLTYDASELEKRFLFLLFFVLVGIAALEYTAVVLASIIASIGTAILPQARWMDFTFWDGSNDPPNCRIYIFYGGCGAILSNTARNCPRGGTRVYPNSCKDHFRYGSRGCGFLGLGCQSLCYNVNNNGCPCSMFTWTELDDVNMPGSDLRSMHVDFTSDCRNACASDINCLAFVILPPDGQQNQVNCFLKKSPLPTTSVEKGTCILPYFAPGTNGLLLDVTTFVRIGQDSGAVCSTTLTTPGPFDAEANPPLARRSLPEKTELLNSTLLANLIKRTVNPNKAFPYNTDAIVLAAFLRFLYAGVQRFLTQERTTVTYPRIGFELGSNTMQGTAPGQIQLTNTAAPRWAGNEITYRIMEVVRTMVRLTNTATQPANPITAYLNAAADNSPLGQALFPTDVRNLLTDNENQIQAVQPALTWGGRVVNPATTAFATPFNGVQVGYDRRFSYFQRGNTGPFSLEAAFLLAAQVAGVNWNAVTAAGRSRNPQIQQTWFTGVLQPRMNSGTGACLTDDANRQIGYTQYVRGSTFDSPRAGVYIALDLDPDLSPNDPNHNVFIFVVHTQDRASIIHTPNVANLQNVGLTRYTPETDSASARFHLPDGTTTNAEPGQPGNPNPSPLATRPFAHAHAALMNYQQFTGWVAQGASANPSVFPEYTAFGFLHIYILGEDFDPVFPRLDYLNRP